MTMDGPVRIAMWSGPRNISTALMRAFENRSDTAVTDEPLYGHFLLRTGLDHPGREEVIRAQETDWQKVTAALLGPVPDGKPIWYQKHMTHHLLPEIGRAWLDRLTNCFLIRDPHAVLASYVRTRAQPSLEDLGLPQQVELFEQLHARTGRAPPVVDAADVLTDPSRTLGLLCQAIGIPFSQRMLSWPAGRRPTDGVWAPHWYASVWRSTGFRPYRPAPALPTRIRPLADACRPLYRRLHAYRLRK
jgi:Sulfotransferase domain